MSHFYGKLQGNRGLVTRCGSYGSGITATCASWAGSVKCLAYYNTHTGEDWVHVVLEQWHGNGESEPVTLYRGPLEKYNFQPNGEDNLRSRPKPKEQPVHDPTYGQMVIGEREEEA